MTEPRKPQDHKKPAAQLEAEEGGTVEVEGLGVTFTIPAQLDDAPADFLEALEDDKAVASIRTILGDEQFAEWKKLKPSIRDFKAFSNKIAVIYGFTKAGE